MKDLIDILKQNDFEKLTEWLNEKNYTIDSIIDCRSLSLWILKYGDLTILSRLLEQRGRLINELNGVILEKIICNKYTQSQRREQLPCLIQQGLCFAHPSFQDLCTGNLDAIKERYALDPDYVFQQDSDQLTLIHYAAALGELEAFEWLASTVGMNVNAKTDEGYTALHLAARNGHLSVVRYLVEILLVDVSEHVNEMDGNEFTAFQLAVIKGHLDVVHYFVESSELQEDVNERVTAGECEGFTALHLAMFHRQLPALSYFLENQEFKFSLADSVEVDVPWSGFTVFHIAVLNGDMDPVRYLLENWSEKIDVNEITTNNGNYDGMTPLHIAANLGFIEIVRYLIEKCGSRIDVNKKTYAGRTALFLAAEQGYTDVVRYFLENPRLQAELNLTYQKMTDFFVAAVRKGNTDTVRYLIENWSHKFSVNTKVNNSELQGCSVLHVAVLSREIPLIHYLLENPKFEGDIETKTSTNVTPLMVAYDKRDASICLLLLEHHANVGALLSSKNFVFYPKNNSEDWLKLNNTLVFAQALQQRDYEKALDCLKQNASMEVNFLLHGESPLHLVVKHMHENPKLMMALLEELLKKNPNRLI